MSYCAAAESGAAVFGIETTAKLGGQSATTTGPMVINSKNEAYQDVTFANPDDVYKTWIDYVETEEKAETSPVQEEKPAIRFCRKCGFELIEGSEFCSSCGTAVIKE